MQDSIEITATLALWPRNGGAHRLMDIIDAAAPVYLLTQEIIRATWRLRGRGELFLDVDDTRFCEERERIVWVFDASTEFHGDFGLAQDLQMAMGSIAECYLGDMGTHLKRTFGGTCDCLTKCESLAGYERERA